MASSHRPGKEAEIPEAEKTKIVNAIDVSNNALADANEQLEKAEAMIKKANFLISKAEPMRVEETAWLEQLSAQSDQILKPESEKKVVIAEAQSRLTQLAAVNHEDLKSQALARPKENRKQKLSSIESKLISYERPV